MRYILLIHHEGEGLSASAQSTMMQEYMALTEDLARGGKLRGGDRLESSKKGVTVRVRNGKAATIDGPFAETKEQLGGYYIVEAKDIGEAVAIAARVPGARTGSIEVRPIVDMPPPHS